MVMQNIKNLIQITEHWAINAAKHIATAGAAGGVTAGAMSTIADNHANIRGLETNIEKKDLQMDTATKVAGAAAGVGIAARLAKRNNNN